MWFPVTRSTKKGPRASPLWGLLHLYCKLVWWPTSEIIAKHRHKSNLASMAGFNRGGDQVRTWPATEVGQPDQHSN